MKVTSPQISQKSDRKPAIGFNGFDYTAYQYGYKVVPQDAPLNSLPSICYWTDRAGQTHGTHMLSSDFSKFDAGVLVPQGGKMMAFDKASPGTRWVPDVRGDF